MTERLVPDQPILVQKYGGSSVATVEHIQGVAQRVARCHGEGRAVAVVVSAMGKTTDELVGLSRQITGLPRPREMDMLLHAGEIISSSLLSMAITELGVPARSFTGLQAGMRTDAAHTRATIREVQGERILRSLARGEVAVIAGFQGVSPDQEITTLGRGGSDTSAVAIAVGLKAGACEILTDVDGIYTADPRRVPAARKIVWASYDEMLEMAVLGARVLHSRSVEIARKYSMPFQVAHSQKEVPGTWVCTREFASQEFGDMEQVVVRGVPHNENVAKVSFDRVPDQPGIAARLFESIGAAGINIHFIVQAQSHAGTNDITFIVDEDEVTRLRTLTDALIEQVGGQEVVIDENVATVSVVGEGIAREPGVAAKVFKTLADAGINIDLISTSNLMITCVVASKDLDAGLQALHRAFFEAG